MSITDKSQVLSDLLDEGALVQVVVVTSYPGLELPVDLLERDHVVLALSRHFPKPMQRLRISPNVGFEVTLTFDNVPFHCIIPWGAVQVITTPETANSPAAACSWVEETRNRPRPSSPLKLVR